MFSVKRFATPGNDPRRIVHLRSGALPFKAPDDHLAYEEEPVIDLSPRIDLAIRDYFQADSANDEDVARDALSRIVDQTRADHASAGLPIYSHNPLPDTFARLLLHGAVAEGEGGKSDPLTTLLQRFEPSVRSMVHRQLLNSTGDAVPPSEPEAGRAKEDVPHRQAFDTPEGATAERSDAVELAQNDLSRRQQERIVKPYRRYSTPSMGEKDLELQEADALARNADISIRELDAAILRDPRFASEDPLFREFLAAMRRYFSPGSDRAVAGVRTRFDDLSIEARDRYASYDPWSDRIHFSKRFNELSREEKIITIIHEALHTTLSMKREAAGVRYYQDHPGGRAFAMHEADVDNLAKKIAKRLGLIPRSYPETRWQSYYRP